MTKQNFVFVQALPLGRPKKEQELEQAKARSHAAKIVHRRGKETARQHQQVVLAVDEKHAAQTKEWLLRQLSNGAYPSDYTCYRGMRLDPFYCIPFCHDRSVAQVIDFAGQIVNPSNDIVADLFDVTDVCAGYFENMANTNFFHAGMALLQTLWEQMRAPGSKPSQRILMHKGEALSTVRGKLSHGFVVDDLTLCALLFLSTLERAMGNLDAFAMHKRNIASIVSLRGGLEGMQNGSIVKGIVMQFDCFWALPTGITMYPGERREYNPTFVTHPYTPAMQTVIAKLPPGFRELVHEQKLSTDTIVVLSRAADAGLTSSSEAYLKQVAERRRWTRKYNDFWEACPCLGESNENNPPLDKLVTLALMAYVCMAFSPARGNTSIFRGARLVLSKLCPLYHAESLIERECLIWAYVVAIDAWKIGSGVNLSAEGIALLSEMRLLFPEVHEKTVLASVLSKFFWNHAIATKSAVYGT